MIQMPRNKVALGRYPAISPGVRNPRTDGIADSHRETKGQSQNAEQTVLGTLDWNREGGRHGWWRE